MSIDRKHNYNEFPRDHYQLHSDWYRFYRVVGLLEKFAPGETRSDTKWLDIGCHSGAFIRTLIQIYNLRAEGCDVYPEADKIDRKYESFQLTENDGWQYHQIDASTGLPFLKVFDVISALELIEHIVDTDKFLEDVRNHLREGGIFCITTPNINMLHNRIRVPFGMYPFGLEYRTIIHHVRLYNCATIRAHLITHGFDVLAIAGVQMLPRNWITRHPAFRMFSEWLSDVVPGLAPNLVVIARKRRT